MARRRVNTTKLEITQIGLNMFVTYGYTNTTPKMICETLDISPGSLTYYFPTKEHMLCLLVSLLSQFQWIKAQKLVNEGETPLTALCLELTAMAAMCEESEVARDIYLAAYTNTMSLDIIRKSDIKRAKDVFKDYRKDWTHDDFVLAETIVSGIEYGILMNTPDGPTLEMKIKGAMNGILKIYGVPKEKRIEKIEKALSLDYRKFGHEMLEEFKEYVKNTTDKYYDSIEKKGLHYVKVEK